MDFRIIVYLCLVACIAVLLSVCFGIEVKVFNVNAVTWITVGLALITFYIAGYFVGRQDESESIAKKKEKIYTEHL